MGLLEEIRRFEGTETELIDFLLACDYVPNDTDHDSWDDVALGPHPSSFSALRTIPASLLPREILFEVYRRHGLDVDAES